MTKKTGRTALRRLASFFAAAAALLLCPRCSPEGGEEGDADAGEERCLHVEDPCGGEGWRRCAGEAVLEQCYADEDGCLRWTFVEDCGERGMVCRVSAHEAECECPVGCPEGYSRCRDNLVQTCVAMENGCLAYRDTTDCAEENLTCRAAECVPGSGDSCLDFAYVSDLPFFKGGDDFTEEFRDLEELTDPSCLCVGGAPEAVFAVDLEDGQTLLVRETGAMNTMVSLQRECGGSRPCIMSEAGSDVAGVRYTAVSDERIHVILESRFSPPFFLDYEIRLDLVDPEHCGDGADNDLDGLADCDDEECFGEPAFCAVERNCADGRDNDADGDADCADPDCLESPWCSPCLGCWERFGYGDEADVGGMMLTFVPDPGGPDTYTWEAAPGGERFAVEPGSGDESGVLELGGDDFVEVKLEFMGNFVFYGQERPSMFVGSNGFVTFGEGDRYRDLDAADFFEFPRIAGFDANLDTLYGGTIVVDRFSDRVVVTYDEVQRGRYEEGNSFQVTLGSVGTIAVQYLDIAAADGGIAGITNGMGDGTYPEETDFVP